jgi:hypothetical protein
MVVTVQTANANQSRTDVKSVTWLKKKQRMETIATKLYVVATYIKRVS